MRRLLAYWFTFDGRVGRREYLLHGAGLMIAKYVTDAALIFATAGAAWLPSDYVTTGSALGASKLAGGPQWLPIVLAAWTVPFLWAGLTLTARRAMDARLSPWFSLSFFVPVLNYLAMTVLCVWPSAIPPAPSEAWVPDESRGRRRSMLEAAGAGTIVGGALAAISLFVFKSYGAALFFGSPFVMGAVTGFVLHRRYPASSNDTLVAVTWSQLFVAAGLMAFAIEGFICMLMAFPLAISLAWLGGKTGRFFASFDHRVRGGVAVVLLFPLAIPLVDSRTAVLVREVRTVVEIDAAPDVVWRNVVTFPRIAPAAELLFRAGIAAPIGARIEGEGIGAVRYCEFTTGDFVEPVTGWEPGRRLAFDITTQPAPMRELSPYRIKPPHLDGYFRATRGEFRLEPLPGGRTRVVGSTWYELDIHPAPYFAVFADYIVGRIHGRVLAHITAVSTAPQPASVRP